MKMSRTTAHTRLELETLIIESALAEAEAFARRQRRRAKLADEEASQAEHSALLLKTKLDSRRAQLRGRVGTITDLICG